MEMENRSALRDARGAGSTWCVLPDPIGGDAHGLVGTCLLLAHSYRDATIAGAEQRIAHHPGHPPNEAFDLVLLAFKDIEKLRSALPGILSDDRVHGEPPLIAPS